MVIFCGFETPNVSSSPFSTCLSFSVQEKIKLSLSFPRLLLFTLNPVSSPTIYLSAIRFPLIFLSVPLPFFYLTQYSPVPENSLATIPSVSKFHFHLSNHTVVPRVLFFFSTSRSRPGFHIFIISLLFFPRRLLFPLDISLPSPSHLLVPARVKRHLLRARARPRSQPALMHRRVMVVLSVAHRCIALQLVEQGDSETTIALRNMTTARLPL